MYDYATVTMQNKILIELQNLNNNLVSYNENFVYLLVVIIVILFCFISYRFIIRCLGK